MFQRLKMNQLMKMSPRISTRVTSHISTEISNTLILCHKGNNYKAIEKLASHGSNICVIEQIPKNHERTHTYSVAEHICEKLKRPCISVLQCDMYNPKYINYAFNETEDIYGSIDGLVVYNEYKWDCNVFMNKYLDSIKNNGNIMIVDPNNL